MKHYFVYVRKSTDEKDRQILSISAQMHIIREYVNRHNLEVIDIFRESKSAMKSGRALFNSMIKRLENGEADGIIAHKTDRLSRNDIDSGKIFGLMKRGYDIIFVDTPVVNNAIGRATLGMQFVWAKFYSENLSEEAKKGMREKLRNGGWPAFAPVGYLNSDGKVIPDPVRAPYIKKAYELYASGEHSIEDIVSILYEDGFRGKTGLRVEKGQVHRILTSPFYYGSMKWDGDIYKGNHQAIVNRKLWNKIQEIMSGKARPHPIRHKFVYRGFLTCGECGCSITAQITKGHIYYRCTKAKHRHCKQPYIREEELSRRLAEVIKQISIDKDTLEIIKNELKTARKMVDKYRTKIISGLKQRQAKLESRKKNLWDMRIDNAIPKENFEEKLREIVDEEEEIKEKLDKHDFADNKWYETCSNFLEFASQSYKIFINGKDEHKRAILRSVCSNLVLRDRKIVDVTYKKPFDILAKTHTRSKWSGIINALTTYFIENDRYVSSQLFPILSKLGSQVNGN